MSGEGKGANIVIHHRHLISPDDHTIEWKTILPFMTVYRYFICIQRQICSARGSEVEKEKKENQVEVSYSTFVSGAPNLETAPQ